MLVLVVLHLVFVDDLLPAADDQSVQQQVPVVALLVFEVVQEGQRDRDFTRNQRPFDSRPFHLRTRRRGNLERIAEFVGGRRLRLDTAEQPSLGVRKEKQLAQHDGTARLQRVALRDAGHDRRHVPRPFDHTFGVDAPVKQAVAVFRVRESAPTVLVRPGVDIGPGPYPLETRESKRLAGEFLGREQSFRARVPERSVARWVNVGGRRRPEPFRHRDLDQQVLEVIRTLA